MAPYPVDPNSANPGKNITYNPQNPYNLDANGNPLPGTGNYSGPAMPKTPAPVNPTPASGTPQQMKPSTPAAPTTTPPATVIPVSPGTTQTAPAPLLPPSLGGSTPTDTTPTPPTNNPLVSDTAATDSGITTAPPEPTNPANPMLPPGSDQNGVTPSISLPTAPPPTLPNYAATYDALRSSTGLAGFQTSLAQLNAEKAALQANSTGFELSEPIGESQGFSNARLSEEQRNTQARLAYLNVQETALNGQIANATTYISDYMQNVKDDYNAAVTAYNTSFTQAVQKQDLYNTKASDEQKAAAAYLQSAQSMISTSGITWDKVSPAMKATIQLEEIKAGWPAGSLEAFAKSKPNANIVTTVQGVDPNTGDKTATIIYQDPTDGSFHMSQTMDTQASASTGAYSTSTGNNPLNITLGSATQKYVNSGQATVAQANGLNFLQFSDPQTGLQAGKDLLFNPDGTYWNMTVDKAMKTWSGNGYDGSIAADQGVDPQAYIRDLTPTEQDSLINAMMVHEGSNPNTVQRAIGTTGSPTMNPNTPGYTTKPVVAGMTQSAIDQDALASILGLPTPVPLGLSGTGPMAQIRKAIANRAGEMNAGGNIAANKAQLTALSSSLKTQTELLNSTQQALTKAEQGGKLLISSFQGKVNSNTIPIANVIGNAVLYNLSPADIASYKAALAEISTDYSMVFSRGGQRSVETDQKAQDIIDGKISVNDLNQVLQTLNAQGQTVISSSQGQVRTISQQINGIIGGGTAASFTPGQLVNYNGTIYTVSPDGKQLIPK